MDLPLQVLPAAPGTRHSEPATSMLPHDGQPTELDLRTSAGSGAITTSRMLAERAIGPCPPKALPDRTTVNVTGLLSTSRPARPDPARRRRRTAHTTRARQRAAPALRGTLQMNCTSARSALRPGLRTTVAPLCSASRQNDFAGTNASSAASLPGLTWPPPRTSTNARAAALRPTEASTTCTPAKPTINTSHKPRRHNRHRPPSPSRAHTNPPRDDPHHHPPAARLCQRPAEHRASRQASCATSL